MHNLVVEMVITPCPIQRFDSSCFQLGMMFAEALWPILARWSNGISGHQALGKDSFQHKLEKHRLASGAFLR